MTRRSRSGRGPWVPFALHVAHLLAVGAIAASNALLGVLLLATPWLLGRETGRGGVGRELGRRLGTGRPAIVPLALYSLLLVASIAFSYRPEVSSRALSELFSLTTLLLALVWVRGERRVRLAVDLVTAAGALFALHGLGQLLVGYGGIDQRIRGPFSHWMTFSGILLIADLLLVARLVWGERLGRLGSAWRWAALLAINGALLASLTRSAWVAVGLALLLLGLLRARRLARTPQLLAAAGAGFLVLFLLLPVPVLHRVLSITDPSDPSNYDRLCMAEAARHMVAERPLLGLGPEMVEERYPIYRHPTAPRYWVPHLHDSFLELAAERGLPALGAYLWLVGASMVAAWRVSRGAAGAGRRDLGLGALLALVAFNVAALFENNWGDTEVQRLVLFVLAMPFCLEATPRREPIDGTELAASEEATLPAVPAVRPRESDAGG